MTNWLVVESYDRTKFPFLAQAASDWHGQVANAKRIERNGKDRKFRVNTRRKEVNFALKKGPE